jgi:hypothetical protein
MEVTRMTVEWAKGWANITRREVAGADRTTMAGLLIKELLVQSDVGRCAPGRSLPKGCALEPHTFSRRTWTTTAGSKVAPAELQGGHCVRSRGGCDAWGRPQTLHPCVSCLEPPLTRVVLGRHRICEKGMAGATQWSTLDATS